MTSRFYRLPSLNALATFEASARHRSLKRAADELNVTSGAVSRQIKALEEELGVPLFSRAQSGLSLTTEGGMLYAVLSMTFSRTAETVEAIRADRQQQQVTVACTHAFAKCWLMPRMADFWRQNSEICLNHLISDDHREFRRAEVDLRIRYGFGDWPDEAAVLLFGDVIYPVASPHFAERHQGCLGPDLPKLPLLHVDWVDRDWTSWDELLRRCNVVHSALTGRRFNSFEIAMQACREGQGVAIGWDRLVSDMISKGELVRYTPLSIQAPGSYYLTWNKNSVPKDAISTVRTWLLDLVARDEEQSPDRGAGT